MVKRFIFALLPLFLLFIVSCGPSRSVKVDTMFQPKYNADYSYQVGPKSPTSSGYTIGIINTTFIQKNEKSWKYNEVEQQRLFIPFQREVSNTIEKILINKGNRVSGPFAKYEEMTYPERERCSFLTEPTVILDLNFSQTGFRELPDVGGPNLEAYMYGIASGNLTGSIDMEYVILDPLTREKLERHKLKTITISQPIEFLAQGLVNQNTGKGHKYRDLNAFARELPSLNLASYYSGYYNQDNVTTRMFEALYKEAIPQIDKLISVEEFNYLSKYKKTLEQKKVY